MNKVITINLNGAAYQLEESGYDALRAYLDQAAAKLAGNPDKDEIMKDFEQAVAEKCQRYLTPAKNVVTNDEVQTIIADMGPVDAEGDNDSTTENADAAATGSASAKTGTRRLYRIRDGEMFLGVCNGLAVYFNVDVTLVRLLFVLVTLLTSGFGFLAYFVMVLIFPRANTIEDAGVNSSMPFTAHEFISEAQKNYSQFRNSKEWKQWEQDWKTNRRQWKQQWKYHVKYGAPAPNGVEPVNPPNFQPSPIYPLLNIVKALLALAFIAALATIVLKGTVFNYVIPAAFPLWAAVAIAFVVYQIVKWPLQMMKYQALYGTATNPHSYYGYQMPPYHHDSVIGAIVGPLFFIAVCWIGYAYIPGVHHVFDSIGTSLDNIILSIRAHVSK